MTRSKTFVTRVVLAIAATAGVFAAQGCVVNVTPENAVGVMYVYTRPGCNACMMSKPIVNRLKEEGFNIKVIDVRNSPKKAGKAGVAFLPTFIHYADGKETRRIEGTASEFELRGMFRP